MKESVLFSIIIPIYNTAEYLENCLDSIINQNFNNFEIICINDGSTDNSTEILKKYTKIDSRIKAISQKNSGIGKTRNKAIEIANGEYLVFVDSDDFIKSEFLNYIVQNIINKPDVVIFGADTLYENNGEITQGQYSCTGFKKVYNKEDLFKYHSVIWNKIYKTKFIKENNILNSTTPNTEDQIFVLKALLLAQKINIISKNLYIYRKNRQGSITNRKLKNDISPIVITKEICEFLSNNEQFNNTYEKIMTKYITKSISWYGKTSKEYAPIYYEALNNLLNYLKTKRGRFWWDYFNLNRKNSYILQKTNIIKAKIMYIIREKLIIIPAAILFFIHMLIEWSKK